MSVLPLEKEEMTPQYAFSNIKTHLGRARLVLQVLWTCIQVYSIVALFLVGFMCEEYATIVLTTLTAALFHHGVGGLVTALFFRGVGGLALYVQPSSTC